MSTDDLRDALLDEMADGTYMNLADLAARLDALIAQARQDGAAEARAGLVAALELVGELVVDYHQTGSIRDHVDPGAKGWEVNKDWRICEDVLCEAARSLLAPPTPALTAERLAEVMHEQRVGEALHEDWWAMRYPAGTQGKGAECQPCLSAAAAILAALATSPAPEAARCEGCAGNFVDGYCPDHDPARPTSPAPEVER